MGAETSQLPCPENTSIVIVGGGFGGMALANALKSTGKMTLINPSDYFYHNIGGLRAAVEPEFTKNLLIPYKDTYGDSFTKGTVVGIDKQGKSISLASGEEIRYSHLILATGSSGSFPGKLMPHHPEVSKDEALQLFQALNKEIKQAETVVVIGGGAVGTELAGEIKTDYPSKNVILTHSSDILCSKRLDSKAQSELQQAIAKIGIQLMLNERVSNLKELEFNKFVKDQVLKTETGKEVEADLVFRCTGLKPTTEAFKDALGDAITEKGRIKVDQFFRVEGTEDIYAIGDITNIDEEKMLVAAVNHGEQLGRNIIATFQGKKMQPYKPQGFMMVVPLGRNGGVSQMPGGMVFGSFITKNLKSKELFYRKSWDGMKQKPPNTPKS